jgi:hypothetical protein
MARQPKITPAFKKKFLRLLSETGNVSKCCIALHISRFEMYNHRKKFPKFKDQWEAAYQVAISLLEDEAWRRAFTGIEKDVWYKGEVVGTEKQYSDTLLMNRLQAELPDKYQYRQKVDANVTADLTIKVVKFANGSDDTK